MVVLRDLHSAFNTISTVEYTAKSLPSETYTMPDSFRVHYQLPNHQLVREFLNINPVLMAPWVKASVTEVMRSLQFKIASESVTSADLRAKLQINSAVPNRLRDITMNISGEKGVDLARMILTSKLFNEFYVLQYELSHTEFSWQVVLDLILGKLIVPEHALHKRTKISWNNYILRFFISHLRSGFKSRSPNNVTHSNYTLPNEGDFFETDYLLLPSNVAQYPGWMSYLLYFADGVNPQARYFPQSARQFSDGTFGKVTAIDVMGRKLRYNPLGGEFHQN